MGVMWKTLGKHSNSITSVTSILAIPIAIIGFWATWEQISETKDALRAGNSYQIQKDGRELINEINASGGLFLFIEGDPSEEVRKKAKIDTWNMINFYLSVYRQVKSDGLNEEFKKQYIFDFCNFIGNLKIQSLLVDLKQRNSIGQRFEAMKGEWCASK